MVKENSEERHRITAIPKECDLNYGLRKTLILYTILQSTMGNNQIQIKIIHQQNIIQKEKRKT